jgi:hypothetical protein
VLKKAAATATVGVGASGGLAGSATASRDLDARRIEERDVTAAFRENASPLLADLAADGLLDRGTVAELPTRDVGFAEVAKKNEGAAYLVGDDHAEIDLVKHVDDGVLTVTVEPDDGRAYAFFSPSDEDTRYVCDATTSGAEVSSDCETTCTCTNILCDGTRSQECTTCCNGDCKTDYWCNC